MRIDKAVMTLTAILLLMNTIVISLVITSGISPFHLLTCLIFLVIHIYMILECLSYLACEKSFLRVIWHEKG